MSTVQIQVRIQPDATGTFECRELGLLLRLEEDRLVLFDARMGERVPTEAEHAEARARAAEEEIRRLRQQLAEQSPPSQS